jgi:hypothetical protein
VRALYLAAGVTDIYAETCDEALLASMLRQWDDLASAKSYLTGGIGSRHYAEAIGDAYELPPDRAYCETCASIASMMWKWRMLLVTGESFADLFERTLYNGFLSGLSLDGESFFYANPLHRGPVRTDIAGIRSPAARRTSCGCSHRCTTYQGKQYCYPIGTNSVGLFYNKAMLKAAGLQPPTTWDELAADAKKLTKPPVYGMAFDATADEQSTWQLEPFFWSNGASLTKVDTPPFQSSLQLWVNMVKDGSASKSVLNWGQDPDLTQQFIQGHAAMMVNGPWIFPELNQKGWKYNDQYGIVPIPTDKAGQTVVAPLGGETIDLGTGGSTEQQKLAWEWLQGMQQTSTMEHVTSLMYYLPTKPAVTDQVLKGGPEYTVFAKETQTARSRTTEYGANYPKVSQAIWTAIQSAITGTSSVGSALQTAQGTISGVQQVSGG